MPHQCVRCSAFYTDDAKEIMQGCSSCSGKLFFFVKQSKVEQAKQTVAALTEEQKLEIAEEVEDVIGYDPEESDDIVVLDLESINMVAPGKYELDLKQLFANDKPIIYKVGEGKYVVDLVETFEKFNKQRKP